jgi:glycerophosphoryl diester phosphodiesterase
MSLKSRLENTVMNGVDLCMAALPRRRPAKMRLQDSRLIAHRGLSDGAQSCRENTLAAFSTAAQSGAWGIEFDVRFTLDHIPVILHDRNCQRVFGTDLDVSKIEFKNLRDTLPELPTLAEVITRFAKKTHLMIEIKEFTKSGLTRQLDALETECRGLTPATDFHFISLDARNLEMLEFAPKKSLVAIATTNTVTMSDLALKRGYGGFAGHYALVSEKRIKLHHDNGQKVGTGFAESINIFRRELNRDIDWVFTNRARKLAVYLGSELGIPPQV